MLVDPFVNEFDSASLMLLVVHLMVRGEVGGSRAAGRLDTPHASTARNTKIGLIRRMGPERNFRNFVDYCLTERGWDAPNVARIVALFPGSGDSGNAVANSEQPARFKACGLFKRADSKGIKDR